MSEVSLMKKTVLCTMVCLFLFLLPQMAVGMDSTQNSEGDTGIGEWTILIGVITRPRAIEFNGGKGWEFNCFLVRYTTHFYGNIRSGFFYGLHQIYMPDFHYGWLGFHFVAAKFNMALFP